MEIVLNTYGNSLSKDNNGFIISGPDGQQRIPAYGIESIRLSNGTRITSDAILYAIQNEIEVLFMEKSGMPAGRVWSSRYGSISTIRKGQLSFVSSKDAVNFIVGILERKIQGQQAMIHKLAEASGSPKSCKASISRLENYKRKISSISAGCIKDVASELRGLEGGASRIYFNAYNRYLPVESRFKSRSQHPALDLPNAMLNYGYGILYGKVESALICAGIDPYIGILHRDDYNKPVLVYDVIEPFRIWVDYVVYRILCQGIPHEELCSVSENGAVFLENLGRKIIIQSFNDYLEELIDTGGISRSRDTSITLEAQRLAQTFKQYC